MDNNVLWHVQHFSENVLYILRSREISCITYLHYISAVFAKDNSHRVLCHITMRFVKVEWLWQTALSTSIWIKTPQFVAIIEWKVIFMTIKKRTIFHRNVIWRCSDSKKVFLCRSAYLQRTLFLNRSF